MSMFDLVKTLSDAEIEYVLVGGLAVALHGYQRVTLDIDVVLAMTPDNLRRFIGIAKSAGLRPVIPVPIDALVEPAIPFDDLRRDAVMVPVGPLTVPVASIEHLIAMKTGTGRSKDAIDIEELRKLQAERTC